MNDLRSILKTHTHKRRPKKSVKETSGPHHLKASYSEIPDIFFDQILVNYKLSRVDIMVFMHLYRQVWCRPNLYKLYGLSQILSHTEIAKQLNIEIEDVYQALCKLEDLNFIETIRSGQYFVRKYFTAEYDSKYGQSYDDF